MSEENPVGVLADELRQISARAVCFALCEEREGATDVDTFRLRARTRSGWLRTAANVLLSEVRLDAGRGILFAIADGNDKDEGCAVAAAVVITELGKRFDAVVPWAAVADTLRDAFLAAHRRMSAIAEAEIPLGEKFDTVMGPRKHLRGIGAAATAVVVNPTGQSIFAHVGDCRACLLHDRRATQVTTDHTLATAIARGEVEVEQEVPAAEHIVLHVLGMELPPRIDIVHAAIGEGDSVVLLSSLARSALSSNGDLPVDATMDPAELITALFDRVEQGAPAAMVVVRRDARR